MRLLAATIDCISDAGVGATTTAAVARRAGLSEGALFKHFPTKADLLATAAETLYDRLLVNLQARVAQVAGRSNRLGALLWLMQRDFSERELQASCELQMLARHDEALRAALRPVLDRHWGRIVEVITDLFPEEAADRRRFVLWLDMALCVLQGAAVASNVRAEPEEAAERLAYLEALSRGPCGPFGQEGEAQPGS